MLRAIVITAALVAAQAVPYAQQGRGRAGAPPAAPRETTVRVAVHDADGGSVDGVQVALSGGSTGQFTTAGAGLVIIPNLIDGTYRVRAEKQGFVTLEREFTLKAGNPASVDLVLNRLPPAPPPPPTPVPKRADRPPSGPPVSLVVADFIDRNFIGREPMKESVVACSPLETVRVLQTREAIAAHAHSEVDELIYVVAGEGSIRLGEEEAVALKPSSLVVVPRGLSHQFERRGKNPLIMLSTLTGDPCAEPHASK